MQLRAVSSLSGQLPCNACQYPRLSPLSYHSSSTSFSQLKHLSLCTSPPALLAKHLIPHLDCTSCSGQSRRHLCAMSTAGDAAANPSAQQQQSPQQPQQQPQIGEGQSQLQQQQQPQQTQQTQQTPLVQYVVLRRDLWSTLKWPLGSIVAQACHASTAALATGLKASDPDTATYCSDANIGSMHKVSRRRQHAQGVRARSWCVALKVGAWLVPDLGGGSRPLIDCK